MNIFGSNFLITGVILVSSCSTPKESTAFDEDGVTSMIQNIENKVEPQPTKTDFKGLINYSRHFKPVSYNISRDINDSLDYYGVDSNSVKGKSDSLDLVCKILLLKGYLSHLRNANQSYNLRDMRRGASKYMIEYYLAQHHIDLERRFIGSQLVYGIESKVPQSDETIKELLLSISRENDRLESRKVDLIEAEN